MLSNKELDETPLWQLIIAAHLKKEENGLNNFSHT